MTAIRNRPRRSLPFPSFEPWSVEPVSDFGFRASDFPSRHRDLLVRAGDEVLELHAARPLLQGLGVDLQLVHRPGADAAGRQRAVFLEAAVVARAAELLAVAGDVDEAAGVRADDVPRDHARHAAGAGLARALEVDGPHR